MALHIQEAPKVSVDALNAALPRIAQRASVATHAPAISESVGALMRRRFGEPTAAERAAPGPITAPVSVVGLNEIAAKKDLKKAPVKVWAHMLQGSEAHPVAVADTDARTGQFQAITEGAPVAALGRRIRTVEAETAKGPDYDLAILRVPALYLDALWLKGRDGAPDVVIPEESAMSPLTPGKRYSLEEFNAALKPTADRLLRETDPDKGG